MTPERGRELRRDAVAYGEMEMAGRAVRAMGDLLWEAQILSESDGGTGEYARRSISATAPSASSSAAIAQRSASSRMPFLLSVRRRIARVRNMGSGLVIWESLCMWM